MMAAAAVASGADGVPSGRVATDTASHGTTLSSLTAHTLNPVLGTTLAWQLADVNGCKPMTLCTSLQTHLASRFGDAGDSSCFGDYSAIGDSVLLMMNNTLQTVISHNCCATPFQFSHLTAMTRLLMNIDACPKNTSVPQKYVSSFDFKVTPIYSGLATSMLTTATETMFSSTSTSSSSVNRQTIVDSSARVAPAVGTQLQAGVRDIIFDLGECCPPYFEFINQNQEHTCCHEACPYMVDILGMYFTMEECCADGANQSGTYVNCP
ncbi:hypothetical protein MMPV_006697 [Pyropia vietnamensis]